MNLGELLTSSVLIAVHMIEAVELDLLSVQERHSVIVLHSLCH